MRKIARLIILFSLVSCNEVMKYPHELEEKLAELDIVIERKEEIEAMKKAQLADLRKRASSVSTLEDRFTASEDLYNAYYKYNTDSALFYARQYHNTAMASGQTYHINRSAMFMADSYTMSGMYAEASRILNGIDTSQLSASSVIQYYHRKRILNDGLAKDTDDEILKAEYTAERDRYVTAVLTAMDPSEESYSYIYPEMLATQGKYDEAIDRLLINIGKDNIGKNTYAINCYILAQCYQKTGDTLNAILYYTISSINDLEIPIYGYRSLYELSMMLYELGDIERAYRYMLRAQKDITDSNHIGSAQPLYKMVPIVSSTYEAQMSTRNKQLQYTLITLIAVMVCLIMMVNKLSKQRKRTLATERQIIENNEELKILNQRLSGYVDKLNEANDIKDSYLGRYLDMCSNYIEGLSRYRSSLRLASKTGGANLLAEKLKSNDFIDTELKKFYSEFDATFIELFPNFVAQVNKLLQPDKQIEFDPKHGLTTELRVLALIRLGIHDSVQIAKFLRRSTSTIYNYRVKMRNSAIGKRVDFEQNLMKIGKISK